MFSWINVPFVGTLLRLHEWFGTLSPSGKVVLMVVLFVLFAIVNLLMKQAGLLLPSRIIRQKTPLTNTQRNFQKPQTCGSSTDIL